MALEKLTAPALAKYLLEDKRFLLISWGVDWRFPFRNPGPHLTELTLQWLPEAEILTVYSHCVGPLH